MNPLPSGNPGPAARITALDGLRGLAVLFVLVHHFGLHLPSWLDWGPVAPNIFFLLSGYLITCSLMKMQSRQTRGQLFSFHTRRLTRLLPALYAMLFVGWLIGLEEFRSGLPWHATFLSNVQMTVNNDWSGHASHLWSLSTQEQFYLLWPAILFLPARWLFPALLSAFVGAALFRLWCLQNGHSEFFRWFMLPGSLDAFAAGGLIAWTASRRDNGVIIPRTWRWPFLAAALGCWALARNMRGSYGNNGLNLAFIDTLETLVFAGLLIELLQYDRSLLSRIFAFRPLRSLGRVSYGLYLWHMLVFLAVAPLLDTRGWNAVDHPYLRCGILILVSTAVAYLSWTVLEKPFIDHGSKLLAFPAKLAQTPIRFLKALFGVARV